MAKSRESFLSKGENKEAKPSVYGSTPAFYLYLIANRGVYTRKNEDTRRYEKYVHQPYRLLALPVIGEKYQATTFKQLMEHIMSDIEADYNSMNYPDLFEKDFPIKSRQQLINHVLTNKLLERQTKEHAINNIRKKQIH